MSLNIRAVVGAWLSFCGVSADNTPGKPPQSPGTLALTVDEANLKVAIKVPEASASIMLVEYWTPSSLIVAHFYAKSYLATGRAFKAEPVGSAGVGTESGALSWIASLAGSAGATDAFASVFARFLGGVSRLPDS